jgi:hypothetical protein
MHNTQKFVKNLSSSIVSIYSCFVFLSLNLRSYLCVHSYIRQQETIPLALYTRQAVVTRVEHQESQQPFESHFSPSLIFFSTPSSYVVANPRLHLLDSGRSENSSTYVRTYISQRPKRNSITDYALTCDASYSRAAAHPARQQLVMA